ncbi:insulin-like growth factor-binding protein complex acid labile subunit [Aricia agestis]|uniref:insulin-like growth factor-binding protein complex acid labile subunit n=1 Tax=Aricia agestis TaxID=91739 RepID=UPI001C20B32E|nr:insulin-like growth factor-binding protein complex acid labile subunit [Aricia agestis]
MSPACASPATEPREHFHRIGAGATGERARSPATAVRRGVMLAVALLHSVRSSSAVTWRSGSGTRLEFDSSTNYLSLSCEESGSYSCGELAGAGGALAVGAGRAVAAARLHVRDCELRAPLACVPGVATVTELMLENTWEPISLGLAGLSAVQSIEIEADDSNITMTSMPYATLSGLADLTELRLRGGVSSLAPGAGGAELARLRDLEVAECEQLRELPAAALRPLPALAALSLWGNSIRLVHKDALFCQGSTELKLLNLNDNELSSLPAGVFIGCAALTDLHLNRNRLRTLFDSAVAGATWLERVDLSYNELEVLPLNELGGLRGLVHLDVSHNRLRAVRGAYRDGRTLPLPLLTLNLSGNNLTTLDRSSLEGLLALQELDLSENYLMRLNPDTFFAVRMHLTNLSISSNGLVVECGEELSPLRELTALRHLELARNNLTAVCGDWRALPHLHSIDLSHNTIRRLDVCPVL